MATQALMPVEEYLRKHFEREPEYRDGILEERAMPEFIHGQIQILIGIFLGVQVLAGRLAVVSETRMRLRLGRYVLPDVAIFEGPENEKVPTKPPLAVIEVLSADDSIPKVLSKFAEYHAWGVKNIWLIDPDQRNFQTFDGTSLSPTPVFSIPEHSVTILAEDLFRAAERMAPKS
jgi:Uma2 family endonuclease